MRRISFAKYHGAGNDYILVEASEVGHALDRVPDLARSWSRRRFGVGSDGLIVVTPDAGRLRMRMWNSDGSRGAVCGNGLRCVAVFGQTRGLVEHARFTVESDVMSHDVEVFDHAPSARRVRVDVGRVTVEPTDEPFEVGGAAGRFVAGSVGNPHAVIFTERDLDAIDVEAIGAAFQRLPRFPDGVNVEFVRRVDGHVLEQRTFERGSGETLACGSGATVVVAAAIDRGIVGDVSVTVRLRGGDLEIAHRGDGCYDLIGPVEHVFDGSVLDESPA